MRLAAIRSQNRFNGLRWRASHERPKTVETFSENFQQLIHHAEAAEAAFDKQTSER